MAWQALKRCDGGLCNKQRCDLCARVHVPACLQLGGNTTLFQQYNSAISAAANPNTLSPPPPFPPPPPPPGAAGVTTPLRALWLLLAGLLAALAWL